MRNDHLGPAYRRAIFRTLYIALWPPAAVAMAGAVFSEMVFLLTELALLNTEDWAYPGLKKERTGRVTLDIAMQKEGRTDGYIA